MQNCNELLNAGLPKLSCLLLTNLSWKRLGTYAGSSDEKQCSGFLVVVGKKHGLFDERLLQHSSWDGTTANCL
jgi:hypothetical protein